MHALPLARSQNGQRMLARAADLAAQGILMIGGVLHHHSHAYACAASRDEQPHAQQHAPGEGIVPLQCTPVGAPMLLLRPRLHEPRALLCDITVTVDWGGSAGLERGRAWASTGRPIAALHWAHVHKHPYVGCFKAAYRGKALAMLRSAGNCARATVSLQSLTACPPVPQVPLSLLPLLRRQAEHTLPNLRGA